MQAQLSWEMREETLLLTFNIVDRFFQKVIVTRGIVQLVGLAATWIAAKYEEVGVPHISQFVDIAANIYTKDNICHMVCVSGQRSEKCMLSTLDRRVLNGVKQR